MNDPKKPPPIPNTPRQTLVEEKRTLVEEGTHFRGSLISTCPLVIQGSIEGTVGGAAVTVTTTGTVSGKVAAGAFKSDGKIAGEFDVDTAELAGTVEKNTVIRATSLNLRLTAPTGKLQLTFGGVRRL